MVKSFSRFLLITILSMSIAQAQTLANVSAEQEHIYLVQLMNQLNALVPVIRSTQKAQPKNQRVSFHYSAWLDGKGQKHNGLLEDIQAIKKGVAEKLNTVAIEPRFVAPIQGDYLDQPIEK